MDELMQQMSEKFGEMVQAVIKKSHLCWPNTTFRTQPKTISYFTRLFYKSFTWIYL